MFLFNKIQSPGQENFPLKYTSSRQKIIQYNKDQETHVRMENGRKGYALC